MAIPLVDNQRFSTPPVYDEVLARVPAYELPGWVWRIPVLVGRMLSELFRAVSAFLLF